MELMQTYFERTAYLFPKQRGNVSLSHLTVLDAILLRGRARMQVAWIAGVFGNWHTIDTRMNRWAKAGVLDRVFAEL